MTCREYKILINEYLDGEICRENEIKLFQHLSECTLCQLYFYDLKSIKGSIRTLPIPNPDEGLDYVILSKTNFRRVHPISVMFRNLRFKLLNSFTFENLRDMLVGFPLALIIFAIVFSLFASAPQTFENAIKKKYATLNRQKEVEKMVYNVLYMERTYQFTPDSLSLTDVYIPRISAIPLKNLAEKYINDSSIENVELIATITKNGDAKVESILEINNDKLRKDLINTLNLSLVLPAIADGKKINSRIAIKFDKVVVTG